MSFMGSYLFGNLARLLSFSCWIGIAQCARLLGFLDIMFLSLLLVKGSGITYARASSKAIGDVLLLGPLYRLMQERKEINILRLDFIIDER